MKRETVSAIGSLLSGIGMVLIAGAALMIWQQRQPGSDGLPPIRSPIEQVGSEFIQHYAAVSAEAYRNTQREAGTFDSLEEARDYHQQQLAAAQLEVFRANLQPVFDTVNGDKWNQDQFAKIMGHLADGMARHGPKD